MKLLRKLRDRHDNRLEDLSELTKQVETAFKELDAKWMGDVEKGTELLRCRQLLLDERRRLSPTGDID